VSWELLPLAEWSRLSATWDELAQLYCAGHPLLDALFLGPLLDSFGGERTYVAVQTAHGTPVRMMLIEDLGWGAWETFSPPQLQIAGVVAAPGSELAAAQRDLWRSLPGVNWLIGLQRWDEFYQGHVSGLGAEFERVPYATTMSVSVQGTFEDYWKTRPKKLRSNVGRYFRRVEEAGIEWRFTELSALADVDAAIIRYGELESRGWKGEEGSAIHEGNEQGTFYRAVMANFARHGSARVYELHFNDDLVASRISIESSGMLVFLKTTYDEQRSEFAPGRLLLRLVLERIFERSACKTAEFYTNASTDQLQWSTQSRQIVHINCHRSRWLRSVHGVWHRLHAAPYVASLASAGSDSPNVA
jgi:hypothetical protein